jgi:hypothetical protein
MKARPASSIHHIAALLTALALAACAGSPSRDEETPGEASSRDGPRPVLQSTTPGAAAAHSDAGAGASAAAGTSDPQTSDPAAGRPGRLLIYSAITGHVPLEEKSAQDAANRYRSPAEREAARARAIEAEIQEEIARQEELDVEETGRAAAPPAASGGGSGTDPGAGPLDAPSAPELRQLPDTLFEAEEVTIPPGSWQNRDALHLVRRHLDVDHDGRPEEVRYVDAASGVVIRSEHDLDFDGELDAWVSYENGEPVVRVLDTDGDGEADAWERYAAGRMDARTLDRDGDGVKDSFYRYEGGVLVEKLHDANNDGTVDKLEIFRDGRRVRVEEDRSLNGWMDSWTHYGVVGGREVVTRIERDTRDRGKPDVFETYETTNGETRIARKEEDVNGDGSIDVVSTYENGKLVQRAISDEALSPL